MRLFITGANRGLGFELGKIALLEGHTVFAGAYAKDSADALNALRLQNGCKLEVMDLDITSDRSVDNAIKTMEEKTGALDCLVNNAGILLNKDKMIDEITIDELRSTFEINTFGHYRVLKAALPLLYKGKGPVIINMTSEASSISNVGVQYCSYSMSKVAATMMSQMFSNLLTEKGFKVYAMHPGRMAINESAIFAIPILLIVE